METEYAIDKSWSKHTAHTTRTSLNFSALSQMCYWKKNTGYLNEKYVLSVSLCGHKYAAMTIPFSDELIYTPLLNQNKKHLNTM